MDSFKEKYLLKKVDGSGLGIFRAVFGLFMCIEIIYFLQIDFIKNALILPKVLFPYTFLEFIQPLSEPIMDALLFILLLSAVAIMLGKYFKIASWIFGLGFLYLLLIGKGHYNNHTYMFSLVAILLSFTNADRRFSIGKTEETEVPLWQYQIIRAQLFIVYFYGGITKMSPDWIFCHEPIRSFLSMKIEGGVSDVIANFFSWGGILFDLLIGFGLFYRKTRSIAVLFVLFFNFSNAYIFDDIGIFPFIMLLSTVIFFDNDDAIFQKIKSVLGLKNRKSKSKEPAEALPVFLIVFFVFQLLFPFRHWLLPHQVDVTGIGQRFSWRMKAQSRATEEFQIQVENIQGQRVDVSVNTFVNTMQMRYMSEDPVMVWQFAQFMKEEAERQGIEGVKVFAKVKVRMNKSEAWYIVNPETDLCSVDYSPFKHNEWILPRAKACYQ